MNKRGEKPELADSANGESVVSEFKSAVGEDSLTRFDKSNRRRKKPPVNNRSTPNVRNNIEQPAANDGAAANEQRKQPSPSGGQSVYDKDKEPRTAQTSANSGVNRTGQNKRNPGINKQKHNNNQRKGDAKRRQENGKNN